VALSIKDEEADRLARELVRHTGETLTEAVVVALRERLARLEPTKNRGSLVHDVERIARRNAARIHLDTRSADAILGYDEWGLPS
jgi:antitoxin VapB